VTAMGKDGRNAHRVSVTFTREQYSELERIAKKNGASLSWVVRRAGERLIVEENGGPMLPLGEPADAER
jgi:metal-responsive CopG/Arc/MetJ family transcriptional regulator